MTESSIDFGPAYVELQETLEKERGKSALLQKRNGELIDAILKHKINTTPGSAEAADQELWNTIKIDRD